MAYKIRIEMECEAYGCIKKAQYRVLDFDSHSVGLYCVQHTKRKLRELKELEAALKLEDALE